MARMGASESTSSSSPIPECPLCYRLCQQPVRLRCGHCFCHECIQELWSGSPTGPYYCPECREEYGNLPAFAMNAHADRSPAETPTRAAASGDDQQPSFSTSPSSSGSQQLGKRSAGATSEPVHKRPARGQNLPSASSNISTICHFCLPAEARSPAMKTCLMCGASMCADHLKPHLESPVFQNHILVPPQADISLWRCQDHQEINKIYCQECAVCVCTVCTLIGQHRNHTCISVADAERELRKDLKKEMKKMQENKRAVQATVTELEEKKQNIQDLIGKAKDRVQQHYRAIWEALEREEIQALQTVSREERRALGVIESQLEQQKDILHVIQNAVGTLEHLSDAKATPCTQEQAFVLVHHPSLLTEIPCPSEDLEPAKVDEVRLEQLQAWAEKRRNAVVLGPHDRDVLRLLYGVVPSLNENTAHPKLLLSENSRKVTYCEEPQPYPELSTRFSVFPQVLGTQPQEGGRSYWEVEVVGEGRWKVGVCEARVSRKGADDTCRMGFNPYSWCLYGDRDKTEALHDKIPVSLTYNPLRRVGVYLDLEEGCLSFYSVTPGGTLNLLHSFCHDFTQPLFPALAVSKAQLAFCNLFQSTAVE
ncbi:tripartite motif-containing protein 14-like isoform X1 [Arapaima gigas]